MINAQPRPASRLTRLQRRRLCWRMARGMPLTKAAARIGLAEPEAGDLLADAEMTLLVGAYRAMAAMPEDARLRRLGEIAARVLEDAVLQDDRRAALFVMKQLAFERDPAEELARSVICSLERKGPQRGTAPPDPPPADSPPPDAHAAAASRSPSCPVDNATSRAAFSLRSDVLDEIEQEMAYRMAVGAEPVAPVRDSGPPRDAAPPADATKPPAS